MDFRLGAAIKKYLEERGILGDCDIISLAGAAKNLVSPTQESDRDFVLRQIEISKHLHNIKEVILMNHTDCGAYGGRDAFSSAEAERNKHVEDLEKSKDMVRQKYPELQVRTMLAEIKPDGQIVIQKVER